MYELERLRSPTRRDGVADAIRSAILRRELRPGARLKDIELTTKLGVSRPTVREAVRQLVLEGLLLEEPYRGVSVAVVTDRTLVDVAEIRVALETVAAVRLVQNWTPAVQKVLETAVRDMEVVALSDEAVLHEKHLAFHRLICELAGIPILNTIWMVIESQIRLALSVDQVMWRSPQRIASTHRTLFNALRRGDASEIEKQYREHISDSVVKVIERLRRKSGHSDSIAGTKSRAALTSRKRPPLSRSPRGN